MGFFSWRYSVWTLFETGNIFGIGVGIYESCFKNLVLEKRVSDFIQEFVIVKTIGLAQACIFPNNVSYDNALIW